MGLLDDAIREHLDLKRRRGADPTEIERAEREALGPVRRGPEVADEDALPPEFASEPDAGTPPPPPENWDPFEDDVEARTAEPPLDDHEELPPYEPDEQNLAGPEPAAGARPFDLEDEPAPPPHPGNVAPPPPEPEPNLAPHPADPPPPTTPAHLDQETEEYELEPAEGEEGDDVLESTPEFLQDTPDHDRLWFEQRPPRDFDFDG